MKDYEMIIGLEVHVELATKSKIFCGCSTAFGAPPNTQCCPVCMGLPGALPVLNRQVVEYAVKAGLATNCRISNYSIQDRKNYFYPDLPKAYQISQYDLPLCENGYLNIITSEGEKRIGITRIHIEEDAGKLVHEEEYGTLIDLNRCGVPLIEIVSEPDLRSAEEARAYLQKLRAILLCAGVSDCKMNEGSFRCDVNLSVRKKGETAFGTRTEMKNLNSFVFIVKAIEYEFKRQVEAVEAGEIIVQETRRFDPAAGKTYTMRTKEDANDYRYFPDPDLPPICVSEEQIELWRSQLPEMPDIRIARYEKDFGLSKADGELLMTSRPLNDAFEAAAPLTCDAKLLCNLMLAELLKLLPEEGECPISAESLACIADMQSDGSINSGTARKLIQEIYESGGSPREIVEQRGLLQISDEAALMEIIRKVVEENQPLADSYRAGKQKAIMALIGRVMTITSGKANPVKTQQLLEDYLSK